jgi:hypothetical protein
MQPSTILLKRSSLTNCGLTRLACCYPPSGYTWGMTTERRAYLIWLLAVVAVTIALRVLIDLYKAA